MVLVLESNLAFESQHLMHALASKGVQNWMALSEGAGGGVGWLTTNDRKEVTCRVKRERRPCDPYLYNDAFSCDRQCAFSYEMHFVLDASHSTRSLYASQ